jgi:hypothetical protein
MTNLTEPDDVQRDRERIDGMRPRQALYWIGHCAIHGATTFGAYYRTVTKVEMGCLKCHWDEDEDKELCPTCPPAGAPLQADLAEDKPDPTSPDWNNTYSQDEAESMPQEESQ